MVPAFESSRPLPRCAHLSPPISKPGPSFKDSHPPLLLPPPTAVSALFFPLPLSFPPWEWMGPCSSAVSNKMFCNLKIFFKFQNFLLEKI